MTAERVAAVLQLSEDAQASMVGAVSGDAAAAYGRAVIDHAEHLFCGSRAAAEASPRGRVLAWLADMTPTANTANTAGAGGSGQGSGGYGGIGGVGRISTREAWRRFQDQAWCRNADAVLAALGWLDGPEQVTGDNGGRPSQRWRLHPDLARHYKQMMTGDTP